MFSLFEGAQKKFGNLLDYVAATPETDSAEPTNADESRPAEEVSINTSAIAGKVLSYAKVASSVAQEKTNKLKTLVSQSTVFDNLNKQQEQFKESLNAEKEGDLLLPWEGLPNEDEVKQQFLNLSKNPNIFLEDAPVEIDEIKKEFGPLATKLLKEDTNLEKLRYELVPKKLSEEKFWHNYLYRVSLLMKIVNEGPVNENPSQSSSQLSPKAVVEEAQQIQPDQSTPTTKEVEQKQQDKNSPSDDDDWEKELLEAELSNVDYDQEASNNPKWDDEIDELLESCEIEK